MNMGLLITKKRRSYAQVAILRYFLKLPSFMLIWGILFSLAMLQIIFFGLKSENFKLYF